MTGRPLISTSDCPPLFSVVSRPLFHCSPPFLLQQFKWQVKEAATLRGPYNARARSSSSNGSRRRRLRDRHDLRPGRPGLRAPAGGLHEVHAGEVPHARRRQPAPAVPPALRPRDEEEHGGGGGEGAAGRGRVRGREGLRAEEGGRGREGRERGVARAGNHPQPARQVPGHADIVRRAGE
jgi:hypothetical protein